MITPEQAERLAARLLDGRTTRLGGPHIEHARRVAGRVARGGDRVVVAALLHDVVEKDCISWNEFAAAVDDEEVVRLVDVVTRRDGEDERAFLRRCAQDPVALLIKPRTFSTSWVPRTLKSRSISVPACGAKLASGSRSWTTSPGSICCRTQRMIIRHRVTTAAEQRGTMGLPGPSILGDTSRSDTKLDELGLAAEPTALVDTDRIPILDLLCRVKRPSCSSAILWVGSPHLRRSAQVATGSPRAASCLSPHSAVSPSAVRDGDDDAQRFRRDAQTVDVTR